MGDSSDVQGLGLGAGIQDVLAMGRAGNFSLKSCTL